MPTIASTSQVASNTLPKPAGVETGDILLAVIVSLADNVVGPTGWGQVTNATAVGVANDRIRLWYKVVADAASEPASYVFTNAIAGVLLRVSGGDTSNPFDGTPTSAANAAASLQLPALTTENANSLLLASVFFPSGTIASTQGMSPAYNLVNNYVGFSEVREAAGSTGVRNFTGGGSNSYGFMVALRDAPEPISTIHVTGTITLNLAISL